ncbi:MAG: hypothetical protein R2849_14930 [Thermomicrobiales bacterium]
MGWLAHRLRQKLTGAEHDRTIFGCVSLYTGSLRIVYGDGQCNSSERPLNWNADSGAGDIQLVTGFRNRGQRPHQPCKRAGGNAHPATEVIGGGAGLGTSVGSEIWTMTQSAPVEAGSGVFENDGWIKLLNKS